MALNWHIYYFLLVNLIFRGVSCQIVIFPTSAVVNVGEDLTFTCTRNSTNWDSFSYIVDGKACFLTYNTDTLCKPEFSTCNSLVNSEYRYSCDKTNFNLTIFNAGRKLQDTSVRGFLSIHGDESIQTFTAIIQVNVPLKYVKLDPNGVFDMTDGETTQLNCSAVSIPPAKLYWSLDGFPVTTTSTPPPDTNKETVTSFYRYSARKEDNEKIITCTASNEFDTYTENVTLNIKYFPTVQIIPSVNNPYKVVQNATNLQMMCYVIDTNPAATSYIWYKDNTIIEDETTSNYTISKIRKSDAGDYCCVATNTVGKSDKSTVLTLDVLFGITLDDLGRQKVKSGSELTVTCNGESNPFITDNNVRWTKQDNITFIETGKHLIINHINKADKGIFVCTVNITLTPSADQSVQQSATALLQVDVLYIPIVQVNLNQSRYNSYKVIENASNLQLMCSVIDTNPNVTSYKWYKNGSKIATTANYTISPIHRSDGGNYSCDATNEVGPSLMSSAVKLDVLFGITIDDLGGRLDVESGDKLNATCTGQSNPPITDSDVKWTKQNNNTFTQTGRHLIINNTNRADKGVYICTIEITLRPSVGPTVKKSATTSLHVDVLYLPIAEVEPSAYIPYKVIESATYLTLMCFVIDTNPDVISYEWYKDGSILQTKTANYTISTVTIADTGDYSCVAENKVGKSSRSTDVKLVVLYGILIDSIQNQQMNEDDMLILNCTGQSNPAISFKNVLWTKEGNSTFKRTGNQLKISNVDRIDNGSYVCSVNISLTPSVGQNVSVSNSTRADVVVHYVPSVSIIPYKTNMTVIENSTSIVLNCHVTDSYPDATRFTWFKNEELLFHHQRFFNISKVKRDDYGMYTCTATNIAGQSKPSPGVVLNVLYGVSLNISTTQIKVYETEQWSVSGKVDGNPAPTIGWIYTHNDSIVQPLTLSTTKSSITVKNANCQDSGRYTIICFNGIGLNVSRTFDVQILCTPREKMNRQSINVFINESDLRLEAEFVAYPPPNISWSLAENSTELGTEYNISILETEFPYKTTTVLSKVNNAQLDRAKYYATAVNEYGSVKVTFNVGKRDLVQNQVYDSPLALIGGISGAAISICVAVTAIFSLYIIRRRRDSGNKREDLVSTNINTDEETDDYGLKDNPLYGDSKEVYGVVNKNGDNKKRGKQIKSKTKESNRDMVYENSADFLELDDGNLYANSSDDVGENKIREQRKVNNPHKNKDGLIYADLTFDPSKKEFVIHGLENKTNYAFIDVKKTAEPLPSSDEDEVKEMKD